MKMLPVVGYGYFLESPNSSNRVSIKTTGCPLMGKSGNSIKVAKTFLGNVKGTEYCLTVQCGSNLFLPLRATRSKNKRIMFHVIFCRLLDHKDYIHTRIILNSYGHFRF